MGGGGGKNRKSVISPPPVYLAHQSIHTGLPAHGFTVNKI